MAGNRAGRSTNRGQRARNLGIRCVAGVLKAPDNIEAASVGGLFHCWDRQFPDRRSGQDQAKTGKTETRISLPAMRRVRLRIDRELEAAARDKVLSHCMAGPAESSSQHDGVRVEPRGCQSILLMPRQSGLPRRIPT
jgi:hypothetical protein